jgi:predicted amidophosphoribosyltransferase
VPRCGDCPPEPLALARAPFRFHGPVRAAVHRLKFSGWRGVSEALGEAMAGSWDGEVDAVTWVPLSRRRLAERGFDQARALAVVVAGRLDLPLVRLLERDGDPAGSQARRGREERLAAMQGRFHARVAPPDRVLLVDDVLTTGATAAACARALAGAGAARISLLTAARAVSGAGSGAILRPGLVSGSVVARGAASR